LSTEPIKLYSTASKLFAMIAGGELSGVAVPASAYMKYELVLRSRGYDEATISDDVEAFRADKKPGRNTPNIQHTGRGVKDKKKQYRLNVLRLPTRSISATPRQSNHLDR